MLSLLYHTPSSPSSPSLSLSMLHALSLSNSRYASCSHSVTISQPYCPTVSLSHCLTASLSYSVIVSPSHRAVASILVLLLCSLHLLPLSLSHINYCAMPYSCWHYRADLPSFLRYYIDYDVIIIKEIQSNPRHVSYCGS